MQLDLIKIMRNITKKGKANSDSIIYDDSADRRKAVWRNAWTFIVFSANESFLIYGAYIALDSVSDANLLFKLIFQAAIVSIVIAGQIVIVRHIDKKRDDDYI